MKQIARVRMQNGQTLNVRLKKDESSFTVGTGRYNAPAVGEWGIEKHFWGPRQEAMYLEGIPNAIGSKEIEALVPNGAKPHRVKVQVPMAAGFTANDFERIYGEPIQLWLATAIQRAQGGMILQYATLGLQIVTTLIVAWLGYNYYKHPW